ncbi:tyrosinase co-factor [Streptomyces sp. SID8375]|uniref:apotyrosinase chaperone MelC1 n=1 Tax=unclassified Streptomyces TaxID=2593676 RepID=UPI000365B483|nr:MULTISPECIES: tyrosinase family oxidase copper chaperone [unclassified Streptomyces]MCW7983979.1 tyrosinase co-factor [Streptomyces platensis subsp. clarensis]MYX11679.1 tyrosinase co-factor [Streptomyces sp. SID8375]
MSRPTRRQVLHGSAAALTGAVLTGPAAYADTAAARPADGHGTSAGHGPSGGHQMPEPFDEMYQGRHIEGWPADDGGSQNGGHGGHHAGRAAGPHEGMDFVVRIDNDDLHVMRNADGTWISLVNHYETFTTPRALARAGVRELQGADLVPVVTG